MTSSIQSLILQLESAPLNKRGNRKFTRELKSKVVTYVESQREQGGSVASACRDLNLSQQNVSRWRDGAKKPTGKPAPKPKATSASVVKPVELNTAAAFVSPTIVFPSGLRIENLDVRATLELVRELGAGTHV